MSLSAILEWRIRLRIDVTLNNGKEFVQDLRVLLPMLVVGQSFAVMMRSMHERPKS